MIKNLSKYLPKICLYACILIITGCIIGPKSLAYAANVTLAWSSNSEPDLGGYFIYYKTGSSGAPYNGIGADEGNSPIQVPLDDLYNPEYPEYTINGLSDTETTYFVLTAYDTDGNESSYSNEVSYQPPNVPPSNLPPSTPIIMYPETGQNEIDVPLDITTEPFSDPNNDSHSQSQWQISDRSDFSSLVVDAISNTYLTKFSVPHMVLKSNQKYYVRVRFYDIYSEASDWSDTVEFTTTCFFEDLNLNGIPDAYEVDDSVDFNLDGIPDNEQPETIKCVQSTDRSMYTGIEKISVSISEIEAVEMINPETIPDTANRPDDLIFGLILYRLRMKQAGDTATVKIYFSGEIFESDIFYKYDTINGWYDYSEHITFNNDGQSVTAELKDGGYGDSDGVANGVIVDPGGIAAASVGDSSTVSGGNSGCFIATAAFGSKFEKHVRFLRRFRDLYLMPNKIGRAFVKTYYKYSPPMADFIAKHDSLRAMVRVSLLPVVGFSWFALKIGPIPTLAFMLFFISCFIWFTWLRWRLEE